MNLPVPDLSAPPAARSGQYMTFTLQGERYGVEILGVREILEYTRPTTIPMLPEFVHGVINLRGHGVPVIDLAHRFGCTPTQLERRTCILIVEVKTGEDTQVLGMLVDAVNAVHEFEAKDIEPPPAFGTGLRREFIRGMARDESGFIVLLDVDRILLADEVGAFANAASAPMPMGDSVEQYA